MQRTMKDQVIIARMAKTMTTLRTSVSGVMKDWRSSGKMIPERKLRRVLSAIVKMLL